MTESDSFGNDWFGNDWFGNDSLGLDQVGSSQVSGLLALYLRAEAFDTGIRFVLNLPVHDWSVDRYSAILQAVVSSREDFHRYLQLLLETQTFSTRIPDQNGTGSSSVWNFFSSDGSSLLENLVKAYCRDREGMNEVKVLVTSVREPTDSYEIFPDNSLHTWKNFEVSIENGRGKG